jgi:hypothetical protein
MSTQNIVIIKSIKRLNIGLIFRIFALIQEIVVKGKNYTLLLSYLVQHREICFK